MRIGGDRRAEMARGRFIVTGLQRRDAEPVGLDGRGGSGFADHEGQLLVSACSRRRNGEDIGFAWPPHMAVPSARPRGGEIEAISASLRDLTDFVHGRVSEPWNIPLCLRPASLP